MNQCYVKSIKLTKNIINIVNCITKYNKIYNDLIDSKFVMKLS